MKNKFLSVTLVLILLLVIIPNVAKAAAPETIVITYNNTVQDGDTPTLPEISDGFIITGLYVEDTNKNNDFEDDTVLVATNEMIQKEAEILGVTVDAFNQLLANQGYTIKNTFKGGCKYTLLGEITRENGDFVENNGDDPQEIVMINTVDLSKNLEINNGKIAMPIDCAAVIITALERYTNDFRNNTKEQSFEVGEIDSLEFDIDAKSEEFTSLYIDDQEFKIKEDFLIEEDSIFQFTPEGLKKLNEMGKGKHKVKFEFGNNEIEGILELTDKANNEQEEKQSSINNEITKTESNLKNPPTSDNDIICYILAFVISIAGFITINVLKIKK